MVDFKFSMCGFKVDAVPVVLSGVPWGSCVL